MHREEPVQKPETNRFKKGILAMRESAPIAAFLLSPKGFAGAHPENRVCGPGAVPWNGRPTHRACGAREGIARRVKPFENRHADRVTRGAP